jgi:hypothetical protein
LHWERASLADLFRLITGNDSGVRGEFALDGNASVGLGPSGPEGDPGQWRFQLQARAIQIHRWDLTERTDNPRLNVDVKGLWKIAAGEARAEELHVELPRSNMSGTAVMQTAAPLSWQAQFQKVELSAGDLLAWCRAFQPGISDEIAIEDHITANVIASGWPLKWDAGAFAGAGGTLRFPGPSAGRIDPFHGSVRNGKFELAGLRLRLPAEQSSQPAGEKTEKTAPKTRSAAALESVLELSLVRDLMAHQGTLRVNLHLPDVAPVFKMSAAFGHPLNQGWEYAGGASGTVNWTWGSQLKEAHRSGALELTKAQLQVAGLNQPLKITESRLEWTDGRRSAVIGKADAFGATWSGSISEVAAGTAGAGSNWNFQLRADRLDATELDRWFGPRARPNWLQRLLPSLLGGAKAQPTRASELLRQVSAEGELTVDTLVVEKMKLANVRAGITLRNLQLQVRNAQAQWAGGTVRGGMQAKFAPLPAYDVTAEIQGVSLAELPWPPRWAERWGGTASGKLHLTTGGVGREELLKQLAGDGEIKLGKIELHGWDVTSSAESGTLRAGVTRWTSGQGRFEVSGQALRFNDLQLEAPRQRTQVTGKIAFGMEGDLAFRPVIADKRGAKALLAARELNLSGPLDTPKVVVQPVAAVETRP